MTLRVKKTAVDDYAAGKLTAEQFGQEVNVTQRIDGPPASAKSGTPKF